MDVCVPSCFFLAYNPDLLLFWVVSEALASLYRKLLEGRRMYVLHPLVNLFKCTLYFSIRYFPVSLLMPSMPGA